MCCVVQILYLLFSYSSRFLTDKFKRLIRELVQDFCPNFSVLSSAIGILQAIAEEYITRLFEAAQKAAIHAKRVTVKAEDIRFVLRINSSMENFILQ